MSFDNPVYVSVATSEDENADWAEFQLEIDGTLLLSTVRVQYANASGLKYRNPETGSWRTLKIVGDRIYPPTDSNAWFNRTFVVAVPKDETRKRTFSNDDSDIPNKRRGDEDENSPLVDLIILGLSYDDRNEQVLDFFGKFGEITSCEVKMSKEGTSRGFAFLRFKDRLIQRQVLLGSPYKLSGRDVNVRRADIKVRDADSCRLFVTKLQEESSEDVIRSYFSKFGNVTDVFIPRKVFKNFGFITFAVADSVNEALDDNSSHMLDNGNLVTISRATPRKLPHGDQFSQRAPAPYQGGRGGRGYGDRQGNGYSYGNSTRPSLLNQPRMSGPAAYSQDYQNRHDNSGPSGGVSNQQEQMIYQAVKMALSAQGQQPFPQQGGYQNAPQELSPQSYGGGKSSMGTGMGHGNSSYSEYPRYDGYDEGRGRRNRY